MRTLYFNLLDPYCAKIRVILRILNADITEIPITSFNHYSQLNTIFSLPIMKIEDTIYSGVNQIIRYFNKDILYSNLSNIENWENWLDEHLYHKVYKLTIYEQYTKQIYENNIHINSQLYYLGLHQLNKYLEFLNKYFQNKNWIHNQYTLNDLTLYVMLLSFHYFAYINWKLYPFLKNFFIRIKSRQELNFLIKDKIPCLNPSLDYTSLDF